MRTPPTPQTAILLQGAGMVEPGRDLRPIASDNLSRRHEEGHGGIAELQVAR